MAEFLVKPPNPCYISKEANGRSSYGICPVFILYFIRRNQRVSPAEQGETDKNPMGPAV